MNSEIPPNNLYTSVSRQNVCPRDDIGFQNHFFEPSQRGNFFEFDGIWWHSLFTLTFPWYQFKFMRSNQQNNKNWYFQNFNHMEYMEGYS